MAADRVIKWTTTGTALLGTAESTRFLPREVAARTAGRSGLDVLQVLQQAWVTWFPAKCLLGVGAR
jgi:hypothetical protein